MVSDCVCISVSQGGTGNLSHVTPNTSLGFVQATPSRVLPSPTVNTREALGEHRPLATVHSLYRDQCWLQSFVPGLSAALRRLTVKRVSCGFISSRCDHGHVPSTDAPRGPVQQHVGASCCREGSWICTGETWWIHCLLTWTHIHFLPLFKTEVLWGWSAVFELCWGQHIVCVRLFLLFTLTHPRSLLVFELLVLNN